MGIVHVPVREIDPSALCVCARVQALRSRDGAKLGSEHKDTPYHKDYLEAESEEDKRNAAFAAQIKKVSICLFFVLKCVNVHMLYVCVWVEHAV